MSASDDIKAGQNTRQGREIARPPAQLSAHAIGRESELDCLHAQLGKTRLPLVVTGVGGLGKTTFAQMYWQRHRAEYDHVVWLSAAADYTTADNRRADNAEYFLRAFTDSQQLKKNLQIVFDPQQRPVERFRQVVDALASFDGHNLLVIDNAPEAAAAYLEDLSVLDQWHILLTSRDAIQNMAVFHLDTLAPEEAAAVFERIFEKEARSPALDIILLDIGYHTLTIELLAAYAREKKLDPPALLVLLRQKGLAQLDDYEVNVPRSHKMQDIAAHLRDVFLLELDESEQAILRQCAILPTSNLELDPALVSEDFLCNLFGKKDEEIAFKKRLRRLARMNWLVEKDGGYRCHPVIAETAKVQLGPDTENCGVLIKNVTDLLIPDKAQNEPILQRAPFAPLAEAIFKGVWKEKADFVEADELLLYLAGWLNNYFSSLGKFFRALGYSQKMVTIMEKVLPPKYPQLASSYNALAENYIDLGEYLKGLEYHHKSLAIRKKILPFKHPDLATSYNNLAETYRALGEPQKCLEYNRKAFNIWARLLPVEHATLALSYNNTALAYHVLGDPKISLKYHQKAFAIRRKILHSEHPDLATSYDNLAWAHNVLGDLQKSLEYQEKSVSIREKILPVEHPDLARSYNNLAETYSGLDQPKKSLEYQQKAEIIWEKVLPPEHPDLATLYNNLAATYRALDEPKKCLEYHQKSLSIRKKVLPSNHTDWGITYNNLALTCYKIGNLSNAVILMRRAVAIFEKSLPTSHPSTTAAKNNLAVLEEELKEQKNKS